jgi:hypothetical protein
MPSHRIAKRGSTQLATAGSTAVTMGWVDVNTGFVADRNANTFGLTASTDGTTTLHVADCLWSEKALTSTTVISLADIACPQGTSACGSLEYFIHCTDGTDFQSMSGFVTYAMVNKAGTNTLTITNATGNDAKAASGGSTITNAWTFVTGTNKGTIKLASTTSLTSTVFYVIVNILPVRGAVTLL